MYSWKGPPHQDLQYQKDHIQDSKVPQLIVTGALCLAIAYIGVALRLCSRHLSQTPLKADDYTILGSLVCILLISAETYI